MGRGGRFWISSRLWNTVWVLKIGLFGASFFGGFDTYLGKPISSKCKLKQHRVQQYSASLSEFESFGNSANMANIIEFSQISEIVRNLRELEH